MFPGQRLWNYLLCTDMTTSGLSYAEVKVWSISFSICHQDGVQYLGIEIGLGHVLTMPWSVCTRWLNHCSRSLVITVVPHDIVVYRAGRVSVADVKKHGIYSSTAGLVLTVLVS